MSVNPEDYDKVVDAIKKAFGNSSIRKGSHYEDPVRIPTGIMEFDNLTGGGFPLGKWSHIWGAFSSGKTLIALNAIAQAQKMGLTCAFYDLENSFIASWAEGVGVDVENLLIVEGSVIEETAKKMQALLGVVNVHVIDSVAMGVSADELSADLDEHRPGIFSRTWGKVIRNLNSFLNEDNAIIMLNQMYTTFGRVSSETPAGGNKVDFISSLTVNTKKSSWLYRNKKGVLDPDGNKTDSLTGDVQPSGIELQMRLTKQKVSVPHPLGSSRMRLEFNTNGQFDKTWTLVRAAIFNNIVIRKGAWYELPDGQKVQGEFGVREAIEKDEMLRELCMKLMQ